MSVAVLVQFLCRALFIGPVLRVVGRPLFIGREHIPHRGPVVLAANHLAAVDSLYLALAARRTVRFLAKDEYFAGHGVRGRLARWFVMGTGQIPVDRRGGDSARPALEAAIHVLSGGGAWGVHPEGTRSPDGAMYRGRTGAVRVALAAGAPLVPVAITGTTSVSALIRRRDRVRIVVLPPMELTGIGDDAAAMRAATDAVMDVIAERTGQRRVDEYARRWSRADESTA